MDDPVYAEKYAEGAPKTDLLGKLKQAVDARHTEDLSGLYVSAGGQDHTEASSTFVGAEVGFEKYIKSWLTARGSLATYIGDDEGYGGLDLGLRLQTPSRIAPFAGLGLFNGVSKGYAPAARDGVDNDDDGFIDEGGERRKTVDGWMTAIYPEIGAHLWLNGRVRLTSFGRYFITTEGRRYDHWLVGGQITLFTR